MSHPTSNPIDSPDRDSRSIEVIPRRKVVQMVIVIVQVLPGLLPHGLVEPHLLSGPLTARVERATRRGQRPGYDSHATTTLEGRCAGNI